jgi:hypothetical protein
MNLQVSVTTSNSDAPAKEVFRYDSEGDGTILYTRNDGVLMHVIHALAQAGQVAEQARDAANVWPTALELLYSEPHSTTK